MKRTSANTVPTTEGTQGAQGAQGAQAYPALVPPPMNTDGTLGTESTQQLSQEQIARYKKLSNWKNTHKIAVIPGHQLQQLSAGSGNSVPSKLLDANAALHARLQGTIDGKKREEMRRFKELVKMRF